MIVVVVGHVDLVMYILGMLLVYPRGNLVCSGQAELGWYLTIAREMQYVYLH